MVYDALMLEKLSDDDIKRTIESLAISEEGEPAEGITKEEFEASNTWFEYNEEQQSLTERHGKRLALKDVATSPEDMTHTLRGKDQMKEATDYVHQGEYMKAIDQIMNALQEFKMCKSEMLCQSSIDDALKDLINIFEGCEKNGGLRILAGKSKKYESVLADLKSEYLQKCHTYLQKSEEKDEKYDRELYDQEINSLFKI